MITASRHKNIYFIFVLLHLSFFSFGQETELKAINQFNYEQIDSLINSEVTSSMIDSPAFIVAYTKWNVGSYEEGNADFIGRDNPFDIYIFFQKERELLVQKIDNYSFFQKKVMAGKNTGHFLANSFKAMKKEELRPQADTFYEKDRMVVLVSSVDHQLVSTVKIISRLDTLEYEYPADYSQNKRNLKTYRYKFLSYLDETATEYDKMNAKRENVVFRHK